MFSRNFRRRYNRTDSRVRRQSIVSSRRDFLKIASLATAYAATRGTALAAADEPALGLIFPPLNYPIPPDAKRLYPAGVRFLSDGVGLVTTVRGRLGCKKALRIAFAQFCRNCSRELGFGAQTDELGWSFIPILRPAARIMS